MEEQERGYTKCGLGVAGPQPIIVNQVVGIGETQKTMDIHMRVPRRKPAIEQIIDVYVRRPRITHVEVITEKVIVRGFYDTKTIYTACLPSQPVHAIEGRRIRFTAEVPICGARCGMDADACVEVEYIDYDCDHYCRAYWHKQWERYHEYAGRDYYKSKKKPKYDPDCGCDHKHYDDDCDHKHHHHYDDDCDHKHHYYDDDCDHKHHYHYDDDCDHKHHHDYDDDCDHKHHHGYDDDYDHKHHHYDDDCHDSCPPKKKPRKCCREFDIAVVLKVTAKVSTCREVAFHPHYPHYPHPHYPAMPALPLKPKG
jgi:hypothetical protein